MKLSSKELLQFHEHRPWKIPNHNWKFYQGWNNAIFLHWQVNIKELTPFVPPELEIDTFNQKAWVSLVAFDMNNIRPRNLPSISFLSNFAEINIRTYVRYKGKQGVYFLSIEATSLSACKVARYLSELPYQYANINRTSHSFFGSSQERNSKFHLKFKLENPLSSKRKIDSWLTERYALFQETDQYINQFEIHHLKWKLQQLQLVEFELNYPKLNHLINRNPDSSHYSKGVQVLAWEKNQTKRLR